MTAGEQTNLFEQPLARNSDQSTAFKAAGDLYRSGRWGRQMRVVFDGLRKHQGATYRELSATLHYDDRNVVARRLADLRRAGAVCNGPPRVCRVCGTRCKTWWLASPVHDNARQGPAGQPSRQSRTPAPMQPGSGPTGAGRASHRPTPVPADVLSPAERMRVRERLRADADPLTQRFLDRVGGAK